MMSRENLSLLSCESRGKWERDQIPSCFRMKCQQISVVSSKFLYNNNSGGSQVQFGHQNVLPLIHKLRKLKTPRERLIDAVKDEKRKKKHGAFGLNELQAACFGWRSASRPSQCGKAAEISWSQRLLQQHIYTQ